MLAVATALGIGTAGYYALAFEPPFFFAILLLVLLSGLLMRFGSHHRLFHSVVMLGLAATIGFAAASLHSTNIEAPRLPTVEQFYQVEATVERFEETVEGTRRLILVAPLMNSLRADAVPKRLSIIVRTELPERITAGDRVSLSAILSAPLGASYPGGYDFARGAWFKQIGGMGFATSPVRVKQAAVTNDQQGFWQQQRPIIKRHMTEHMENPAASGLATALLTGDRTGIPDRISVAMREAGLAHILAISGLHMGLVTATIFFLIEALLSLFPSIALRVPPAKIAAVVAGAAALAYLFLSGGAVSTVRAFIMVSVALIAVLLDRRAFSLRSVAIAAILIMLIQPNALLSVGFQMSFAAVTALIVMYDRFGRSLVFGGISNSQVGLSWRATLGGLFIASIMTTLVAEIAIAPFALYHFKTIVFYGLLANMVVIPVISFWVMPLALLSLLLMPFGLDGLVLPLVEYGLEIIIYIAEAVSGLPGATGHFPAMPDSFLLAAVIGGLAFAMIRSWQGSGVGFVAVAVMAMLVYGVQPATVYVSEKGSVFALRDAQGNLGFNTARHSYSKESWQRANGEIPLVTGPMPKIPKICDQVGCLYAPSVGPTLAYVTTLAGLREDCGRADIIIAAGLRAEQCAGTSLVIDKETLALGPLALRFIGEEGWQVKTSVDPGVLRPWSKVTTK